MDTLKFLNKALWITILIFAIYWLVKYLYKKLKPVKHPFFYFYSVEKSLGEWVVRLEAPKDEFYLDIKILKDNKLLVKKDARLKAGINKITFKSSELNSELTALLKIESEDQKLERII